MGKNKLYRWAEMDKFSHVIQPAFEDVFRKDHELKGKWGKEFFDNDQPIVLELGCGKGEYTINLAKRYPSKNFLGIDIKGARMWRGAKEAYEEEIYNVGFLRTRIELISSFFTRDEIDEIWITFPDPQLKKRRNKKRLTGARFLNAYLDFLKEGGYIHLKTDSHELFTYTKKLLDYNNIKPLVCTDDLYSDISDKDLLSIQTHYEKLFLEEGKKITYLRFSLNQSHTIKELPDTDD